MDRSDQHGHHGEPRQFHEPDGNPAEGDDDKSEEKALQDTEVDHAGDLHGKPGEQPTHKRSDNDRAHPSTPSKKSPEESGECKTTHRQKRRRTHYLHKE